MKTILVIDDTREMRENITEILQLAPYEVLQAVNGKEGIELARKTRPDLILCDIMMPELDGFGVLHILAKDPVLADVPFVFLTARAEPADFRQGMELGANDYITKPFDDLTLLRAVEVRLKRGLSGPTDSGASPASLDQLTRAILDETDARQSLCENYPTTLYKRKHHLFTAGSWPTALYFISKGKVKLCKTDAAGNEYITALLGAGDFAGYTALLEETPYAESAEILDDAEVCTIPKADFSFLLYNHQYVANQFVRMLAGDVAELQERLLKLAYQSVRKRVAEALLMYQRKFYPAPVGLPGGSAPDEGQITPDSGRFVTAAGDPVPNISPPMTLSRENWSHLVGASTETVIRILGDLRTEGLIEINASQITLLDIEKLTRLKR